MREGDLLILGTDGVFDNLFEEEILEIVSEFTKQNCVKNKSTAAMIAKKIAEASLAKSKMKNIKNPFNIKKAQVILDYLQK